MSGGKKDGVAHQVIDLVRKIEAQQNGKIAEVIKKHNDLAASIQALEQVVKNVAGYTASEMGKFQGETASRLNIVGRSLDGIDLNVLALAEMAKEVLGQLTQVDAIFKKLHQAVIELKQDDNLETFSKALELSEEEVAKVRTDAEEWYKNLVTSAFTTVQEKRIAAEKAAAEAEAKAQEEARAAAEAVEKAEADKTEAAVVNGELKAASEAERTIVTNKSGGPGTAFPEGADIFGG